MYGQWESFNVFPRFLIFHVVQAAANEQMFIVTDKDVNIQKHMRLFIDYKLKANKFLFSPSLLGYAGLVSALNHKKTENHHGHKPTLIMNSPERKLTF